MKYAPHVQALLDRHAAACRLDMPVDEARMIASIRNWMDAIGGPNMDIMIVRDAASAASAASAARDARDARTAWDASAARVASAAWVARDARDARTAWDASAARVARDARDARDAWDISWVAIIAIGAAELNDPVTTGKWVPLFDSFEAGAFTMWIDAATIYVAVRPDRMIVGPARRLHCETGPAFSWLGIDDYYWNGVMVPAHWITDRDNLDPREVIASKNVEQRAVGAAICGWPKMLSILKAKTIDDSGSDDIGALIEMKLPGLRKPGLFLKARCPRNGIIVEGVPRVSDIDGLPINTALAAQAWRVGDPQSEYQHPPHRT